MQNKFKENSLIIESNINKEWMHEDATDNELIWMHNNENDDAIVFGLSDIPFIIKSLVEIQEYYNNTPKVKDSVEFVKGRMIGLTGKICDIDRCDNKSPLVIRVDDTDEINECTYFCGYDEIKVLESVF